MCVYLAVHEQPEGQSDVHAPFSEVLLTVHSGCGVRRRESHERSSRDVGAVQSDERFFFFPFPFLSQFCNTHTHKTAKHIRSFSVQFPYAHVKWTWNGNKKEIKWRKSTKISRNIVTFYFIYTKMYYLTLKWRETSAGRFDFIEIIYS